MTAEQLLRECRDRLMPYDSKLRERIDAYLSTPAPPPDIAPEAEIARLREACDDFRDTVLHQRGALAENGMTNDQVNDVLGEFDTAIDAAIKETK